MITVVTGASSGLGEALARRLAARGDTVVAIARSRERLEALARAQPGIVPIAADIADRAAVETAVARVEAEVGPIGALVNNAAVFAMQPLQDQQPAEIEAQIATNLLGTIWITRAVVPHLLRRRSGRIVMVASVAGIRGIPGQSVYCASKHGMLGFADALAQELLPHGVLVSSLCPGAIDTPLWSHAPGDGGVPYPGDLGQALPLGEACALVEFLLDRPPGTVCKRLIAFPTNEWH
ncbi:MAG: SDR family oxidoreductase [Planctomycetes bacterium]|nr:SDR family oxidoreductase [Planctomycetota bacterium]